MWPVRLNDGQAFDFVACEPIGAGQELTFDYAMRNFTIDHFPGRVPVRRRAVPRLGHRLSGSPAARKADYGELVALYLRTMDDEIRRALRQTAGG
jgi:uncharacterized protein